MPAALTKYQHALAWRNRILLAGRPDAPDQVDVSGERAEYVWPPNGQDVHSERVGGPDGIVALANAYDMAIAIKPERAYAMGRLQEGQWSFAHIELGDVMPVNGRCVVRAPVGQGSQRNGIYWIGQKGAVVVSGFQADANYGGGRVDSISDAVDWWSSTGSPRLDLDYLHQACGVYWPEKRWVIWSVPMIIGEGAQTTNNRLIIWDTALGCWQPPQDLAVASLAISYHNQPVAPGKLGPLGLYAGDYAGQVMRLYHTSTDDQEDIAWEVETGWLTFGMPDDQKSLINIWLVGTSEADISVEVYTDGSDTATDTWTFDQLTDLSNRTMAHSLQRGQYIAGFMFKFKLSSTAPSTIPMIVVEFSYLRSDLDTTTGRS